MSKESVSEIAEASADAAFKLLKPELDDLEESSEDMIVAQTEEIITALILPLPYRRKRETATAADAPNYHRDDLISAYHHEENLEQHEKTRDMVKEIDKEIGKLSSNLQNLSGNLQDAFETLIHGLETIVNDQEHLRLSLAAIHDDVTYIKNDVASPQDSSTTTRSMLSRIFNTLGSPDPYGKTLLTVNSGDTCFQYAYRISDFIKMISTYFGTGQHVSVNRGGHSSESWHAADPWLRSTLCSSRMKRALAHGEFKANIAALDPRFVIGGEVTSNPHLRKPSQLPSRLRRLFNPPDSGPT